MKTMKYLSFYLIIFLSFPVFAQAPNSRLSDTEVQQKILFYINQYRSSRGLPHLQLNAAISAEATQHSRDMALHRMPFGHQDFPKRIKHLYERVKNCQGGAENVAFNYKDLKQLVYLWTKSPGHKQNIIGHYNLTGIGVAYDQSGKPYYTQIFIRTH